MKPEELLQTLRDAGMEDEAIAALLDEAKSMIAGGPEGPVGPEEQGPVETEDEKFARVFGA